MKWLIFLIVLVVSPFRRAAETPFTLIARRPEALQPLPFGAIRPEGWLESQIRSNLHGFTGHLDSLAPDLILKDDIFGRDRLTRNIRFGRAHV